MADVKILENCEKPYVRPDQELIQLFIHEKPTSFDLEAKEIFSELAEVLSAENSLCHDPVLVIHTLKEGADHGFSLVPCLISDAFWGGVEHIGLFLKFHKNFVETSLAE